MTDRLGRDCLSRLWGEGQILISHSRVLAINCDSLTCEILKNLVLAGTGFIGIVDEKNVDEKDLDNFFVNRIDIGKKRGEVCVNNLLELNPDVKSEFFESGFKQFITSVHIPTFDLIISSNLNDVDSTNIGFQYRAHRNSRQE
jgi:molybdopterin/thiamine biosynthesis adenylyltransferase